MKVCKWKDAVKSVYKKTFPSLLPGKASFCILPVVSVAELVTIFAVHRLVAGRLKRYLGFLPAGSADSRVHLPLFATKTAPVGSTLCFFCCPALGATTGFVRKPFFRVKFLFGSSEGKFVAAVFTNQNFVAVHKNLP